MTDHLRGLARFAQVDSIQQMDHLIVDIAWNTEYNYLPLVVQYDNSDGSSLVRFSPCADGRGINTIHHCVHLTGPEFLSILVWLIRRGLLEDVGLVSTETAPPVGAGFKPAPTEPARTEPAPVGATHASPLQEEEGEEAETEGEPSAPFALPIFELKEGAGDPEWLNEHNMMIYLHHELKLSATDISRLCDTTPARVRGALKRLGIEFRSYRGGRSKLAPRSESGYTVP